MLSEAVLFARARLAPLSLWPRNTRSAELVFVDLNDEQWALIRPHIPAKELSRSRGRPWRDARDVMNGVLWVLRTGARWKDLPPWYPSPSTCHRRFDKWRREGAVERIVRALASQLVERGAIDVTETFIDGSHAGAKRGGTLVGRTRRGKATKIMTIADRNGLPIAIHIASGQRHEVPLVLPTLNSRFILERPERMIGDCAYDSDGLDAALADVGIEMIAPHHPRRRHKTQDGRALRRYRRRWLVERLFSWLLSFRRLVTRYEYCAENFLAMLHLGCALILLRRLRPS